MKNTILTFTALFLTFTVFAQQTEQETVQHQEPVQLTSQADSLQYALGAYLGQWMVKNNFQVQNANLFLRGMDDALKNQELAVEDSTIAPLVAKQQLAAQNERNRQMEEQLFESLKGKPGVGVLPEGVHYIVAKKGTGVRPTLKDTVVLHAVGVFPDGKKFEDTQEKGQPIVAVTENLIPGLREAIQLMPEGSVWRVFVPSVLGYGSAGLPNKVPPYMALVFDIKLLEVKK
jgi:FKBP-type peptidyl-prolyl cis-trans isomerase